MKGARQAVQSEFERLSVLVNAYEIVYGEEAYAGLSSRINEAVYYARQQATRRSPRGKGEEKTVTE